MGADLFGEPVRIDDLVADIGGLQNLQIPSRQKLSGLGDVAGIAAELHAVFRSPKSGGADAFARRAQRPWPRTRIDTRSNGAAQPASHVAEVALLAALDVLAHPAGKHQPAPAAAVPDPIGPVAILERRP